MEPIISNSYDDRYGYRFLSNVFFYKTVYGLLPRITWITPFVLFINACFQRYSWLPNENIISLILIYSLFVTNSPIKECIYVQI